MIINIILMLCLIVFFIGFIFEPRKLNPITIFCGEWFIFIYLSKLNLYNINSASEETYKIILNGCVAFIIGFYLFRFITLKRILPYKNAPEDKEFKINKKLLYIFIAITTIIFLIDFLQVVKFLIQGNNLEFIRKMTQDGYLYNNKILNFIRIIIASPVSWALPIILSVNLFSKEKDKVLIIFTPIILILRLFSDGSRGPFIFFIISFIICYSYYFNNDSKKIEIKKIINNGILKISKHTGLIIMVVIVSLIALYKITLSRSGDNTIRYTYYYFAMEPYMLEKWAEIVNNKDLVGYGMASFNGFLFPLFYVLVNFSGGLINYPTHWRNIYDLIENIGTNWQVITKTGLTANSYVSIFFPFYLDGRIFGVILGMFLYGAFIGNYYRKVIQCVNKKNISLYCLHLIAIIYSFQIFIFENIYFSIAYLLISLIVYKKN